MLLKTYVRMRSMLVCRKGQSLMEYVLLVALIAVVLIGTIIAFRNKLSSKLGSVTSALNRK